MRLHLPLKRSLRTYVLFVLVLGLGLGLRRDGEVAVLQLGLDVVLLEARQVDGQLESCVGLLDVGAHERGRHLLHGSRGGVEERVEGVGHQSLNRLRFLRMGTIIAMFDHLL